MGISGCQNYGEPNPTYGLSILFPISKKVEGMFSFYKWSGLDDNYTHDISRSNYSYSGRYFGNKGFNLLIDYKYYENNNLSLYCGGGLSWYEMLSVSEKYTSRSYLSTITCLS